MLHATVPYILDVVNKVKKSTSPPYRPVLPEAPEDSHPVIITLMTECWVEDPTQRPSFSDCIRKIKSLNRGQLVG